MPLWSRVRNAFRGDGLHHEIAEEIEAHIAEAVGQGRDPVEASRSFGPSLLLREQSRDIRVIPWLDCLRADAVFGCRQLRKNRITSAAAILSLGLAIGACTSAFRLIDALLLRPLPIQDPGQVYGAARQGTGFNGKPQTFDGWAFPDFQLMRTAVQDRAELIAISYAERSDVTYKSDQEMEKACLQYVSGNMFSSFGLRPALGRLLTIRDDVTPGAHPYAVISYDYWQRRFAGDPKIIGRTFRLGSALVFAGLAASDGLYEIVGVAASPFTGTEPGTVTDIFLPTMMHPGAVRDDWTWHRTLVRLRPGVAVEPVRARLSAVSRAFEENRAKGFTGISKEVLAQFLAQTVILQPAAAGASGLQQDYRRSLVALGVLVALVLLIACANVANLMSAQAASRAREMALRVSIGAGRWRLVQLVLVESAILAALAAAIGGLFAWWSAPFVIGMINPPDNPVRLMLPADWRVLGFGMALTLMVMLLFGLAPALRASGVKPVSALKGGEDPHSRRRWMHGLIAAQVAFCFLVLFLTSLFAMTFERLSHRPIGFSPDGLLALDTVALKAQPLAFWDQVADRLRAVPGVESVALAGWPVLGGEAWNGFVSVDGAPPGPVLAYFMKVSPGWLGTMRISLLEGRDFRPGDSTPGSALVNEAFARQYFNGLHPLGRTFAKGTTPFTVVGVVRDVPYRNTREAILPVAYVPMHAVDADANVLPLRTATLMVRTSIADPLALAAQLRREVPRTRPEFRVSNLRTETELVRAQTVRERLLATLALFFAVVALLLGGVGLYGVLNYSVVQRRREIGVRMAIGARPGEIARRVTAGVFRMVLIGAAVGLGLGLSSAHYLDSLLYEVKATDAGLVAIPFLTILASALLAGIPAVVRAVRIDPVIMLRAE